MKLFFTNLLALLCLLVTGLSSAWAADEIALDIFHPFASISLQRVPEKSLNEGDGYYGSRSLRLDATLPLGRTTLDASGSLLTQYFLTTQFQYWRPDISFLDGQHRFYQGKASLAAMLAVDINHFFIFSGGISLAEDESSLSSPELRPAALGVGVYRATPSVSLVYGLAYSYIFGAGYGLPIAGLNWKINDRFSVSTLLPVFVKLTHHIHPNFRMGYRVGISGDRTRFSNNNQFEDRPETLYLSDTYGVLSTDAAWQVTERIYLFGDAGYMGGRKLIVSDQDDRFHENHVEFAPFIKLGIRYFWGSPSRRGL